MASGDSSSVWTHNLKLVGSLSHADITHIIGLKSKTPKAAVQKGYKFFVGSYIHDVEVQSHADGCFIRAKCFRSQKKNDSPHQLQITLKNTSPPSLVENQRSCVAGCGFCQHVVALLYQIAHFKTLGYSVVPPIVSKTSAPQQWHIPPRTHGFCTRPLNEVTVMRAKMKTEKKRKRATEGLRASLYNPINTKLSEINLPQVLMPALKGIEPKPQILQLWSDDNGCKEMVDSKYGLVPKGSFLSYQAPPLVEDGGVTMIYPDKGCCPPISFIELPLFYTVLTEQEYNILEGMTVTEADSLNIEECTRLQSSCPEWHKLRKQRLTASNFKQVFSRQKDFDSLAIQLIGRKPIQTAAMKYGLDHEHEAAEQYTTAQQVNTYPVGFIINPSAPYLGCSPDRRVYDPSEEPPWGLLEIKCPQVRSYTEAKCLKRRDEHYKLKKNHAYYVQVMGQMGLSGSQWCDFMVWCENDYHIERIYYDQTYFADLKARLDTFYYMHYLPVIVRKSYD